MNPLPTPTGRIDGAILLAPTPPATGGGLADPVRSVPDPDLLFPAFILVGVGVMSLVRHWLQVRRFNRFMHRRLSGTTVRTLQDHHARGEGLEERDLPTVWLER